MPLVWISISWMLGILTAYYSLLPANLWYLWFACGLVLLFIAVLTALLIRRQVIPQSLAQIRPLYAALPILFFFSAAWLQFRQPNFDDPYFIGFYNDRGYEILVTGTLAEPPDIRDRYANLKIKVEAVDSGSGSMPASGYILARISQIEEWEYGQRVRVRGSLRTPPENEDFSYRDYLARSGVYALMPRAEATTLPGNEGDVFFRLVYRLKTQLFHNIHRVFHEPEASLFAGILLGVETGLTRDLQQAFKDTGTAHIIAISGFNIAIIAGIFFNIFKVITNEQWGAALAVLGIAFYTLLVGADAAVVRAAFMGSLSLLARQMSKKNTGLNGLAFAVLIMLILNPLTLWDVGFQLSALATLGLILYSEPFSNFTANLLAKFFNGDISPFARFINENVMLTFAAQITTLPIMAYHFQRISLISFIANPFILFAQPAVMILGGLAAIVSVFLLPLGQLLAWAAWPFAAYTIRVVELFEKVPNGVYLLKDSSLGWILAVYIALFTVTFGGSALASWFQARSASLRAASVTVILASLFVCAMLIWQSIARTGDGNLHVTFLEVGSANAILITTPEGRNVLINGGPSATELSDELGRRLPFFSHDLDWLVVASSDEDDVLALPRVMEYYPPQNVLWSGNLNASYSAQQLDKLFARESIPVTRAEAGQTLDLGGEARLKVMYAGGRGIILLVEYKNFRALLPLGMDTAALDALQTGEYLGKVDVFLLADSGYAPSNPPNFITSLNPQLVVLSVDAGDSYGLPNEEVLESLEGYSLLRTDRSGWISVITDGNEMRVEVERGAAQPTPTP